jgi:Ca-activated chloride channel family protein
MTTPPQSAAKRFQSFSEPPLYTRGTKHSERSAKIALDAQVSNAQISSRKMPIGRKQHVSDFDTATTLQKIGTVIQIVVLLFSLVFAFSTVSAQPQEHVNSRSNKPLGGMKIVPIRSANDPLQGARFAEGHEAREREALTPIPQAPIIQDALLLSSEISVEITGMIVHTTVRQTFKNQTNDWIEGMYRFPLPDQASVDSMTMLIGNRRIVGRIKEKEEAKKTYREAVKAGKKAALLQEHRPNMFSTRVGNVAPGAVISVELTFLSYASQNGMVFDWAMPQAITPRFNFDQPLIDGDEASITPGGKALYTHSISAADRTGGDANPTSFSVRLKAGTPVRSLLSKSHNLAVTSFGPGDYTITLKNGIMPADRDFKLSWELTPDSSVKPILFREKGPLIASGDGEFHENANYVLGFLLPPQQSESLYVAPRDVVFIIDTSGSMGGVSIRQAKTALLHALDLLRPEDRFDIIEFNNHHTRLFGKSELVSADTLARARHFVRRLDANGGTNMMPALDSALTDSYDPEAERQILFLTDGAVGYEDQMFKLVEEKLGQARLFTVGIGSTPNGWFMRKAAEFGRGLHIQISDVAKAGEELASLYSAMAVPSLSNLDLESKVSADISSSHGDNHESSDNDRKSHSIESYPARLPDLYGTRPAVFIARVTEGSEFAPLTLSGKQPTGEIWQADLNLEDIPEGKGIAKMWARKKVESLMDARVRGMDRDAVRQEILDVALSHEILSPFTSFVAVEEEVSRPAVDTLKHTKVKGNLPHGTETKKFFGPRTATPLSFKFTSGLLALFIALIGLLVLRYPLSHARLFTARKLS